LPRRSLHFLSSHWLTASLFIFLPPAPERQPPEEAFNRLAERARVLAKDCTRGSGVTPGQRLS
jgi:hypothetical protein